MRNYLFIAPLLLCVVGCSNAPETGRKQFIAISSAQEIKLGQDAFREILSEEETITTGSDYKMVQRIGRRVAAAASRLYPNAIRDYEWKFALIDDDEMVNAWALPGGKCAVYTGLLPVTQNENALAIVMAHEVGHVIARHGAERASQSMVAGAIASYAMKDLNEGERNLVLQAYGVSIALPFSRTQESEADQIGLFVAADAGYDPRESIPLWQRMANASGGAPFEFLSTHPSSKTRIKQLNGWMPKAMLYYEHEKAR
jgi:predicted Zn-dependent protease